MSKLQELIDERDMLNEQIALFATFPEDIYNVGTVVLFSYQENTGKVYYRKVAEELWKPIANPETSSKSLAEWLFDFKTNFPEEYFEVYLMAPGNLPIYASE